MRIRNDENEQQKFNYNISKLVSFFYSEITSAYINVKIINQVINFYFSIQITQEIKLQSFI